MTLKEPKPSRSKNNALAGIDDRQPSRFVYSPTVLTGVSPSLSSIVILLGINDVTQKRNSMTLEFVLLLTRRHRQTALT
jgi:hypothetical protein